MEAVEVVVAGADEAVDVDRCPASSFSPRAVADLATAVLSVINNRHENRLVDMILPAKRRGRTFYGDE